METEKIFGANIKEMELGTSDHTNWLLFGTKVQSVQVVGITLRDKIVPEALSKAVKSMMNRYPVLRCRIVEDENKFHYELTDEEPEILCQPFESRVDVSVKNSTYQWKITYFNNEIVFYLCHGLFDGTGSIEIIKTLLFYYAVNIGVDVRDAGGIKTLADDETTCIPRETELPEAVHYNPDEAEPLKEKERVRPSQWAEGAVMPLDKRRFSRIILDEEAFVRVMKEFQTSPFALMAVIMARAAKPMYADKNPNIPIVVMSNLRKAFDSDVIRNFLIAPSIDYVSEKMNSLPMELCCTAFRSILDVKLQKENCNAALKRSLGSIAYLLQMSLEKQRSLVQENIKRVSRFSGFFLSYMGRFKLPEDIENIIEDITVFPTSMCALLNEAISFRGKIYLNFIHSCADDRLFDGMLKIFDELNIDAVIERNRSIPDVV